MFDKLFILYECASKSYYGVPTITTLCLSFYYGDIVAEMKTRDPAVSAVYHQKDLDVPSNGFLVDILDVDRHTIINTKMTHLYLQRSPNHGIYHCVTMSLDDAMNSVVLTKECVDAYIILRDQYEIRIKYDYGFYDTSERFLLKSGPVTLEFFIMNDGSALLRPNESPDDRVTKVLLSHQYQEESRLYCEQVRQEALSKEDEKQKYLDHLKTLPVTELEKLVKKIS